MTRRQVEKLVVHHFYERDKRQRMVVEFKMEATSCQIFNLELITTLIVIINIITIPTVSFSLIVESSELHIQQADPHNLDLPSNHRMNDNSDLLISSRRIDFGRANQQKPTLNASDNDAYGRSIYSSLLKIIHNMKQQLDKGQKLDAWPDLSGQSSVELETTTKANQSLASDRESLDATDGYPQSQAQLDEPRRLVAGVEITTTTNPQDPMIRLETTRVPQIKQLDPAKESNWHRKSAYSTLFSAANPFFNRTGTKDFHTDHLSSSFSPRIDNRSWKISNQNFGQMMAESNQIDRPLFTLSTVTPTHHESHLEQLAPIQNDSPDQQAQAQAELSVDQQLEWLNDSKYSSADPPESTQKLSPASLKSQDKSRQIKKIGHQRAHKTQKRIKSTEFRIPPQVSARKPVDYHNPDLPEPTDQQDVSADVASSPYKITAIIGDTYDDSQPMQSKGSKISHNSVHLQRVYMQPLEGVSQKSYSQQPDTSTAQQQQQSIYSLHSAPGGLKGYLNSRQGYRPMQQQQPPQIIQNNNQDNNYNYESSQSIQQYQQQQQQQQQRDLLNQPQTIQITAVPNINAANPFFRTGPFGFNGVNGINGINNGFMDPFGRPVFMVNAERRQLDWSFWFWPLLIAVTLPLILGVLFVPVFLRTILVVIQVLQSLGLLLPITNALVHQIAQASGAYGMSGNYSTSLNTNTTQVEQVKT